MTDQLFLNEQGVSVTTTRLAIAGVTYPVNSIISFAVVAAGRTNPSYAGCFPMAIVLGIIVLIASISAFVKSSELPQLLYSILFVLGVTAIGKVLNNMSKPQSALVLETARAKSEVLVADPDFVNRVSFALGKAIEARG
jgi:ABC-type Na+ efflux pump permease subunit